MDSNLFSGSLASLAARSVSDLRRRKATPGHHCSMSASVVPRLGRALVLENIRRVPPRVAHLVRFLIVRQPISACRPFDDTPRTRSPLALSVPFREGVGDRTYTGAVVIILKTNGRGDREFFSSVEKVGHVEIGAFGHELPDRPG